MAAQHNMEFLCWSGVDVALWIESMGFPQYKVKHYTDSTSRYDLNIVINGGEMIHKRHTQPLRVSCIRSSAEILDTRPLTSTAVDALLSLQGSLINCIRLVKSITRTLTLSSFRRHRE